MQAALAQAVRAAAAGVAVSTGPSSISLTYSYTGAAQSFVVPVDVTALTITLYGASGGDAGTPLGGMVSGTITVTPGETLQINVGGQGVARGANLGQGGFNGGGRGGHDSGTNYSAGGGGASDVRRGGTTTADRKMVAGGGGGTAGGGSGSGGSGGYTDGVTGDSGPAGPTYGSGGTGGTQSAAGSGGAIGTGGSGGTPSPGAAGAGAVGGDGGNTTGTLNGGGGMGGGGGYFGGGGGSGGGSTSFQQYGNGGGGGSSFLGAATSTSNSTGVRSGNGQAVVTYASSASARRGYDLLLTCEFFWNFPRSSGTWVNSGTAGSQGDLVAGTNATFVTNRWNLAGNASRMVTSGNPTTMNIEPTDNVTFGVAAQFTAGGTFANGSKVWGKWASGGVTPSLWMELFDVSGGIAAVIDESQASFANLVQANVSGSNQGQSTDKVMYGGRQDGTARTLQQFTNGSFSATVSNSAISAGTLTGTGQFSMGASPSNSNGVVGDFYGGFWTKRKLTDAQIVDIEAFFGCPAVPLPGINFRSVGASENSNGGPTITVQLPPGVRVGDMMLLSYIDDVSTSAPSGPAGWTLRGHTNTTGRRMSVYSRIYQSGDGSTVSFGSIFSSFYHLCKVAAFYGAGSVGNTATTFGSTPVTAASVSVASASGMVVEIFGAMSDSPNFGTPSQGTIFMDSNGSGAVRSLRGIQRLTGVAGATTGTSEAFTAGGPVMVISLALEP